MTSLAVLLATYLKSEVSWLPRDAVCAKTPLAHTSNRRMGRTSARLTLVRLLKLETPSQWLPCDLLLRREPAALVQTSLMPWKPRQCESKPKARREESVQNLEHGFRAF